jgi:RNA polymerase sigma-70 factor (ECF subfamily)
MSASELPPSHDALLIERAKSGDVEAFGELYERYASDIFRFLASQMGSHLDAEDLTEDVFMRAWRYLPRYKDQGYPFSAYLYRIARNAVAEFYRGAKKTLSVSVDNVVLTAEDKDSNPQQMLSTTQEHQALYEALSELREDNRQVLILRFINGLSPTEAAEAMGKSEGSVRVLQHRALKALRKVLNASPKYGLLGVTILTLLRFLG